jgi:hypothetical protein
VCTCLCLEWEVCWGGGGDDFCQNNRIYFNRQDQRIIFFDIESENFIRRRCVEDR